MNIDQVKVPAGRRGRLVVAAANCSVRVFSLLATREWSTVFLITLEEGFLPKAVCFSKSPQVIFAFSRAGGHVYDVFL